MFPFAIYDAKRSVMVHLGLYKDEADCWRVFLGWPTRGEVRHAQSQGLVCLPCAVSYKPPEGAGMRCERCHGAGGTFHGQDVSVCRECNGTGVVSCCDGGASSSAYDDPTYPERNCDFCGLPYRGPAVYCSLECATDDL